MKWLIVIPALLGVWLILPLMFPWLNHAVSHHLTFPAINFAVTWVHVLLCLVIVAALKLK